MASCEVKDASESEVTPPDDSEQTLDFDEDTLRAIAEVYKNEGNEEYKKKHFRDAVYFYTEGIKVGCKDKELKAKLYSNRATAHFYCGNYSDSLSDAKVATDLQPTCVEAIARGASACVKLNLFEEAITWCDKGLATDKENTTLLELRKLSLKSKSADKTDSSSETGAMDDKSSRGEDCKNAAVQDRATQGNMYRDLGRFLGMMAALKVCHSKTNREYFESELGEAKEAEDRDREGEAYALRIAKEVERKGKEGWACLNLGAAYYSLGDFKTAIDFHQQALGISKEVGNKDLERAANSNLGLAYYSLEDFETAIEFYQQVLSVSKETGKKDLDGAACINLGNAYNSLGNFNKAIEFYQQALCISKEAENKDLEGKACISLGAAYNSLGNFKKAIEFYQQALSVSKEAGNKDLEGKACISLGAAYNYLSDFKKSIEFYQQALCISKETGNKDLEGQAKASLGLAYHSLGDFKMAIEFHKQALNITKNVGNRVLEGNIYSSLGIAYYSLGDLEKAIEFLRQGLSIAKEAGSKKAEGIAYVNLGNVYNSLGDFKKAIEFQQQALGIAIQTENKYSEGLAYGNLGTLYHSLGDFQKAIEFHQQAFKIAKEVGDRVAEGEVYMNLGLAYYSLGDFSRAEDFFKSSVRLFDEIRDLLQVRDEWKISLRNKYQGIYSNLWWVQLQQKKTIEALFTAERGRAQALMDLMESQYGVNSARPVSEEQIQDISSISIHIPSLALFLAEAPDSVNFWLLQKGKQCQFLQNRISDTLESLTRETYKQIGVFKSAMCENRSLDEPEDEKCEELPDRSPDEKGLASSENEGGALKTLSDLVIGPISHMLQGDELIIVPDGQLFLVPYAALLDQHSRDLSETLRIRLVPSLTSLKLMAECPEGFHSTSGALLVGDPWVETVRVKGTRFEQLPGARKEVEMIGAILKIDPLTGKDATKAEVLNRLSSVALVHIAAHGRAETGEIVLSPNDASSKRPKQEGFLLTMADVLNAKLRARLVVLSCCHSGRGKIKAEGVVGIARAFLGAGARSVLASLWAINDEATMQFMKHFYEHLMEGQSASTSLNQAMKWMRESDDFSDVKYWAPFVLIGDDVTLSFGQSSIVSDQ